MGRSRLMTIGFLLILIGIQLYGVRTYYLTPQAAKFVRQRIIEVEDASVADSASSQFFTTGYNRTTGDSSAEPTPNQEVLPPSWLKWAALFAGSVLLLQGATMPK